MKIILDVRRWHTNDDDEIIIIIHILDTLLWDKEFILTQIQITLPRLVYDKKWIYLTIP